MLAARRRLATPVLLRNRLVLGCGIALTLVLRQQTSLIFLHRRTPMHLALVWGLAPSSLHAKGAAACAPEVLCQCLGGVTSAAPTLYLRPVPAYDLNLQAHKPRTCSSESTLVHGPCFLLC
eukprot:COSAG06_NODE_2167_length_7426_cov_7.331787_9_plen_121_part_00